MQHLAILLERALVKLIIGNIGIKRLYGGLKSMLNVILQRFWIPKVKSFAKQTLRYAYAYYALEQRSD